MSVETLLQNLQGRGVTFSADGPKLSIRPASVLSQEEADQIRACKGELLAILHGVKLKHPGLALDAEALEIARTVQEHGVALTWSAVLGDFVAFHRDDVDPSTIPEMFVAYSETELSVLFGEDLETEGLQRIHQAKRLGARVAPQTEGSESW